MDSHPVLDRIINLVPTELRDEQTGVYSYNEVAINQFVKIRPKFSRVRDPDGSVRQALVGLTLKGVAQQRKRTYNVKEDSDKPVSYHFWKIVKKATERQTHQQQQLQRKAKIRKAVFNATKEYRDVMEQAGVEPLAPYQREQGENGDLNSFQVGASYRDTFSLGMNTADTQGPSVTTFSINRKHLSVDTIKKIMELVNADDSKPEDLMNSRALKKVRTSLFG